MYHCLPVPRGNWKDHFEAHSIEMVLLHNQLIRSFNSMIYYSGEVQPGTKRFTSFIAYCATMNHYLHHHHWLEETYWFPYLKERLGSDAMDHNLNDHTEVMVKFDVFDGLVKSLQLDQSQFNVTIFRNAIHGFMPRLIEHLHAEPDTFRAHILRKYIKEEDLVARDKETKKKIIASFSLVNDGPLFYINGDRKNAPWFPSVPALVGLLVKHVLYWAHSDIWAFGSTNRYMQVKSQFEEYEPDFEPEIRG